MLFSLDHLWSCGVSSYSCFWLPRKRRAIPPRDHQNFQRLFQKHLWGIEIQHARRFAKKTLLLSARQIFGTVGGANGPLFFENHVIDKTFCFFIAIRVPPDLMKPFSGSDTPPSPENPGFHEIRRLFTLPVLS